MKLTKYIVALMALCITTMVAQAQTYPATNRVSFAWDASLSPSITNYVVHSGPSSGTYTNHVNVGMNLVCTLTNVAALTPAYYAVTAQDAFGGESDYSNEVAYTAPRPKPVPPGLFRKTAP